MIPKRAVAVVTTAAFFLLPPCLTAAQNASSATVHPLPLLSPIFGDNMLLQRDKVNTLWGWSEPGDKVQVEVAGNAASAVAGSDRRWQVKIQPGPTRGITELKSGQVACLPCEELFEGIHEITNHKTLSSLGHPGEVRSSRDSAAGVFGC